MTTLELTTAITKFDYHYCMIDNAKQYNFYKSLERQIINDIKSLTPEQALEVYNGISEGHRAKDFGKLLSDMLPTPEPTAAVKAKDQKKVSLFIQAWEMFKDGLFVSFSEALKAAWSRLKVVTGLKSGVVTFEYIKSDGSVRIAKGTLTGLNYEAKGPTTKTAAQVVKYFDLEAQSFRSFRIDRFIRLVA